jgi:hypothetical protein
LQYFYNISVTLLQDFSNTSVTLSVELVLTFTRDPRNGVSTGGGKVLVTVNGGGFTVTSSNGDGDSGGDGNGGITSLTFPRVSVTEPTVTITVTVTATAAADTGSLTLSALFSDDVQWAGSFKFSSLLFASFSTFSAQIYFCILFPFITIIIIIIIITTQLHNHHLHHRGGACPRLSAVGGGGGRHHHLHWLRTGWHARHHSRRLSGPRLHPWAGLRGGVAPTQVLHV